MRPQPPNQSKPDFQRETPGGVVADLADAAWRYLTDAMTPNEIATFERRLGHDPRACEALAAAVDQLGALQIVAREWATRPAPIAIGRSRRLRSALGAGGWVAAAAVLMVGLVGFKYRTPLPDAEVNPTDVALAWTDLREKTLGGDLVALGTEPLASPEFGDDGESRIPEVPAEQPVPSWMLAVVGPGANTGEVTPLEGQ